MPGPPFTLVLLLDCVSRPCAVRVPPRLSHRGTARSWFAQTSVSESSLFSVNPVGSLADFDSRRDLARKSRI